MSAYAEEPEAVSESVESDESSGVLPVEDAGAALEPSGVLPADSAEDAGAIEQEGQSGSLPAELTEDTGDSAKPVEDTEPSEVLPADPVENTEAIESEGQAEVLPSDEPDVFHTLKVLDTYSDTGVSDVRYEESLPAGQGYSFSALEADGYVVDGATEFAGELTEDTTLEFLYIKEYTVTFYDIVAEEVISEVAVKAGEAAEAPEAPVYEGFKFIGWSEEFNSVSSDLTIETLYQALGVSPMSAGTELSNDYASAILYEDEKRLVVTGMFQSGTDKSNYPWYGKLSGYSVEFTNDVIFIGDYAFQNSGIVGELVIPNSVTSIGSGAFDSCSGLTGDLVIPDSVTSIGFSAFQACKGLTGDLIIPDSVTSIGGYAFASCSDLTGDLIIPDSVTSIGDFAFEYCSGFSDTLILGNSLKTIGGGAFNFCDNITIIQGGENVTTVPDGRCFRTNETTPTIFNTSNEVLLNHDWAAENRVEKAKVLYTISFDSEGGTPVESISVGTNEYAKKPEDPTKPGYKFLGWMWKGYGIFSFDSTTIWEDVILHAIWEEKPAYRITFFSNGGTFVPEISVREDEYAEKPEDPTRENYKFLGWKTSDDAEDYFNFKTTPITQNITLYAQWGVKDTITVTFDTRGGGG